MNWTDVKVAEIKGHSVTLQDVVASLKAANGVSDIVNTAVIRSAAAEAGIKASDAELQAEADRARRERSLDKIADTERWLKAQHLSVDEWEKTLEDNVIHRKVKSHVTGNGKVEAFFKARPGQFDAALLHRIVVADKALADDLRKRLAANKDDFSKLARAHSTDRATRLAGGFAGTFTSVGLDPTLAKLVFAAAKGDVVGPWQSPTGGYELLLIEELTRASLSDPACKATVEELCFREWLTNEAANVRVNL